MIFLDAPSVIRVGDLQASIKGWYAGEAECRTVSVCLGRARLRVLSEGRPDVEHAYPGLFTLGFSGILDFLHTDVEPAYVVLPDARFLALNIRLEHEYTTVRVPVEEGWLEDLRRIRESAARTGDETDLGLGCRPGDAHYRAYVGPPEYYDLSSASTFQLLTLLGLRQHHRLIDVGCGSLRNARLLIPYLNPGNYQGIEPNRWLVEEGIQHELGSDILRAKSPTFVFSESPAEVDQFPVCTFALANSIFTHASLLQIRSWLAHLAWRLSMAGALIATYIDGPEDYIGDGWVYPGCVQYRTDTMSSVAAEYGYRMVRLDWRHFHGASWAVFARPKFNIEGLFEQPLTWNGFVDRNRF